MKKQILLHEKPLLKKKDIIQYSYSHEKTGVLFNMKTDIITELVIVFIGEIQKKFATVISKQN